MGVGTHTGALSSESLVTTAESRMDHIEVSIQFMRRVVGRQLKPEGGESGGSAPCDGGAQTDPQKNPSERNGSV